MELGAWVRGMWKHSSSPSPEALSFRDKQDAKVRYFCVYWFQLNLWIYETLHEFSSLKFIETCFIDLEMIIMVNVLSLLEKIVHSVCSALWKSIWFSSLIVLYYKLCILTDNVCVCMRLVVSVNWEVSVKIFKYNL